MTAISVNEYDEFSKQASLHDKKLKPQNEMLIVSPEQEKENAEQASAALEKLAARHKEKLKELSDGR